MRFRRTIAIASVAAAAVTGTTAATLPSAQVGRSQPLPALTAPALATRYADREHGGGLSPGERRRGRAGRRQDQRRRRQHNRGHRPDSRREPPSLPPPR